MIDTDFLASIRLFSSLSPEQLSMLAKSMTIQEFRPSEIVFEQGHDGDALFVVRTGEIRVSTHSPEGEEIGLACLTSGDFFGELALIDGKERTATAIATEPTKLLKLPRSDFFEFLRHHTGITMEILLVLTKRLRRNAIQLSDAMKQGSKWKLGESDSVCPRLPILDFLQDELGGLGDGVFGLVGLQHLMGSTASLIDQLAADRLDPDDVFLLGKPYSTNLQVMDYLREERRYHVHPESADQPLGTPHNEALSTKIDELLSQCRDHLETKPATDAGRVLLIDDGGHAIRLLHSPPFADIVDRFVCVEQTRSGIRTIEDLTLRVPVVNVAESWVKLEHESPLIAESVKIELFRQLVAIESRGIRIGRNTVVIGYGSIGRTVAARMHGCGFTVSVFDHSKVLRDMAVQDGFTAHADLKQGLKGAELIVGCTGTAIMDFPEYACIEEGAILLSTSSSDSEFRGWQLRSLAKPLGTPKYWKVISGGTDAHSADDSAGPIPADHPCFCLYHVRLGGRSFYLVNGGFPVNFTGEIDPIPPRLIQLTRGLLYAGAIQASHETKPGIHPLSEHVQEMVMTGYERRAGDA